MQSKQSASTLKAASTKAATRQSDGPATQSAISMQQEMLSLQGALSDPGSASPQTLLAAQRLYGNQAVQRLLAPSAPAGPGSLPIQTKLTVGAADDAYEREADQISERVISGRAAEVAVNPPPDDGLRRYNFGLSAARMPAVRRSTPSDYRNKLGRNTTRDRLGSFEAGSNVESELAAGRGSGSPLPDPVRTFMQSRIGADFSGVRVHTGRQADQLNRKLSAQAFTHGSDIYMAQGKYNPGSSSGQKLLAHELTHVVQQHATRPTGPAAANKLQTKLRAGPHLQRRGKTDDEKSAETMANKAKLGDLKNEVLIPLSDKAWPVALSGYQKHNVTYTASGKWGGTSLAKWFRDTNTLDPFRVRAKALTAKKDTAPTGEVITELKTVAGDANKAAPRDSLTADNLSNHEYIIGMVEKIAYYLVNSIPTSVRTMAKNFADITLDLDTELGASVDKAKASGPKTDQVTGDEAAIKTAIDTGVTDTRGFHGSASWLLEGLEKSGGKLLSQKSAFDAGLLKTGEGTTFSSGAKMKTNVYIGAGETGFGTAASYALAPGSLTSYNVSLYSDAELAREIKTYQKAIQLEELLSHMDPAHAGAGKGMTVEKIKQAAIRIGLDVSDPGYARMFGLQNTVQLKEMLGKMHKELEARALWDKDDPRRTGGQTNPDNYPILLEFDLGRLEVTADVNAPGREAKGDYRLAGEATVKDEIDLGSGRLKVVYCPEQFIAKTTAKLKAVFGDVHKIDVRALESIKGSIGASVKGDKTLKATYGQLEKQQKALDVKIKAHKDLAENLDMPEKIYGGKNGDTELTKIKVAGRDTYVDKDKKPVLHDRIISMMMEGVPQVPLTGTPQAVLMMGGPGAGKSSTLSQIVRDPRQYVMTNPDDVKEALPEYQAGLKAGNKNIAGKVHGESKKVADALADKTIKGRHNIIYDATGANKKGYADLIKQLMEKHYQIKLVMVHVKMDEGLKRVKTRAEETGRHIDEKLVKSVYPAIPPNFVSLAPTVDQALLYDNSDKPPKLVWDSKVADIALAKNYLDLK